MNDFPPQLLEMPGLLFMLMAAVGVISILSGAVTTILVNRQNERTRREIAAYVAEGSIEPDQAVALLEVGRPAGKSCRARGRSAERALAS